MSDNSWRWTKFAVGKVAHFRYFVAAEDAARKSIFIGCSVDLEGKYI